MENMLVYGMGALAVAYFARRAWKQVNGTAGCGCSGDCSQGNCCSSQGCKPGK